MAAGQIDPDGSALADRPRTQLLSIPIRKENEVKMVRRGQQWGLVGGGSGVFLASAHRGDRSNPTDAEAKDRGHTSCCYLTLREVQGAGRTGPELPLRPRWERGELFG